TAPLPADGRPEPEHAADSAPRAQPEPGDGAAPAAAEEPAVTDPAVTDPAGTNPAAPDTAAPAEEPAAPPAPEEGADHHPAPEPPPLPDPTAPSGHPTVSYVLHVNGVDRPVTGAWIGESLLHVLRERLGLAGAKDGCSQGECGACSVQVDGRLVAACLVPAATAAGSEIRTVEGLGEHGAPSDVQRALSDCAVQCGFCLPGMAMTVHDLLEGNHRPSELETRRALCGNLCRCSGYRGVLDAVRQVVEERSAAETAHHEDGPTDGSVPRVPHQGGPAGEGGEA
ncbi:(2Fe-2S)-binding protein, partial [Streptomyces lonarensis]|uniref:(2Fe-2S)-binding protein n=2 Tax=Streptomyces lonarensis TaxID=700599 RepID=UPI001FD8275E